MNICNEVITHYMKNNYWLFYCFAPYGINLQISMKETVVVMEGHVSVGTHFACCFRYIFFDFGMKGCNLIHLHFPLPLSLIEHFSL